MSGLFIIIVIIVGIGIIVTYRKPGKLIVVKEKAIIGVTLEPITALFMIAEENGYFSANGLDLTIKYYEGGNVTMRNLLEGKLDFATASDNMVVFNSFKRRDFSVVATVGTSDNDRRIVGRKDRGVYRPVDLRGKRVGTVKGTGSHYFLHVFLLKYGMSVKDVHLVFTDPEEMYQTFLKSGTDAISTREPYIMKAVNALGDNAIVFSEPRLMVKNYNLVATNDFIKKKPKVVRRMLKALIQAEEFAASNQLRAVHIVAKRLGFDDAVVARQTQEMKWNLFLEQAMLVRFEDEADWMIKNKVVDNPDMPNYFQMIDMESLSSLKPKTVTVIR
ncbi:MAG: ABC transporter substrate-binding protein [Nitrospirae bacterium]|nr:ABC transporter substrate-binding protein [Nitrospirota bacterium]